MKTKKISLLIIVANFIISVSTAQINVSSAGNVSVYSAATALTPFQAFGNSLFCSSTTIGSGYYAPLIAASTGSLNSTATTPDYTWYNDNQTGIYHPNSGTIAFSGAGGLLMSINTLSVGTNAIDSYLSSSSQSAWAIWYSGSSSWNFYVYATGAAWAYSYNTLSDARLKENIKTIADPLNKVLKLHGVTFTYKNDSGSAGAGPKTQMGLIAQEVQQVAPEVVNTGKDGYLGVQYQNLVGLLVEAIKQEDKKVTALQNRLDSCCNLSQQYGSNSPNSNGTAGSQSSNTSSIQATLYQNVPNPFTQSTTIQCYLPTTGVTSASILIFDMTGALKSTYAINGSGTQNIQINGNTLSAGMYYYSLVVNGQEIATKKMILTN